MRSEVEPPAQKTPRYGWRLVDICFSRVGSSSYVVDVGVMANIMIAIGPTPRPFPGSGVVWRIVRQ